VSFVNDVMPVLAKAGCSAGGCHAKPEGQNNFKLSIFGYDPELDYREIVHEQRGRRLFPAAPEQSLLLLKATAAMPHEGGARLSKDSAGYRAILDWIKQGYPFLQEGEARLQRISLTPAAPTLSKGSKIQLQVTAYYSDHSSREVSHLADYQVLEKELCQADEHGVVQVGHAVGEGCIIARYMDQVAVCRITIPATQLYTAQEYAQLPVHHEMDKLAYQRFQKLGLLPSAPCSDSEFLRRSALDAIGLLPTAKQAREFLLDTRADKRQRWIDFLLQQPQYADHWATKWNNLIRPNPSRVGIKPVLLLDRWLRESFRANKPWHSMVAELLTARGSSHEYGPVAIFRDKREPADMAGFVSQIFLGLRLECAKCHHHPSERWSQEHYYQLAAFFGRMKSKGQGISPPISGEPEYWWAATAGSVQHPVTGNTVVPCPPAGSEMPYEEGKDPRQTLVQWMTAEQNPFFAKAIVNRVWAEFFGRGIVDPVDDFRESNPATHEALLDWLVRDFQTHGYDLKHLMRRIMSSALYQQSTLPNATNVADTRNFSRALKRRLPAEVLMDAVADLTASALNWEGMPTGSRATQTWNYQLESNFLDAFGRPDASQECPCERDKQSSVVQALHLMNSPTLHGQLSPSTGRLRKLDRSGKTEPELVQEIYLLAYSRLPSAAELQAALRHFNRAGSTKLQATEDLTWALINSAEFVFNH
jgi:hypothetical protein